MSFRNKLIFGIAFIQAVMLTLIIWNALHLLTLSNETELIKRAKSTTELFALSNKNAVLSTDLATLESVVTEVLKHENIEYVRIIGRDDLILAQGGRDYLLANPFKHDSSYSEVDDGIFDTFSVISEEGVEYGRIEIGFSVANITSVLAEAKRKIMTFAALEMLLTAIFSFFLGVFLTRSIGLLRIASQNITSGRLGYQIEINGSDELAETAQSFNTMSEILFQTDQARAKAEKELKELNENLEKTVRRRTEKLRESEKKYKKLVEDIGDKFIIFSHKGVSGELTYVSDGVFSIFGFTQEDVLNKPWWATTKWSPESVKKARAATTQFVEGKADFLQWEMQFIHPDGNERTIRISSHPVRDETGNIISIDGILEDFTEQKRIERQLVEAQQQAEATNRAKSEFLANMSHEIRTPMNVILGMNRLALETNLTKDQYKYLSISQQSAESLLLIINDILDLSKIEAGKIKINRGLFDLHKLIKDTVKTFTIKAREKGIKLTDNIPSQLHTTLIGDELRIRQVLVNLIDNAIKFTPSGEVLLTVQGTEIEGKRVDLQFSIQDTGIGIPPEKQNTIFDKFTQADSSTERDFGGTGLGLAISKKLVELHGGKIWLESEPGQGCTFYFKLPLLKGEKNLIAADSSSAQKVTVLNPLHILLVEDNKFNTELALTVFQKDNHKVTIARDGVDALEKLIYIEYDAVLMDVQMPHLDGIEATKLIRACESGTVPSTTQYTDVLQQLTHKLRGTYIPIIAMTAHAMSDDREKCISAGMDDYVTKPFQAEEVYKVFARVIKGVSYSFQQESAIPRVKECKMDRCAPVAVPDIHEYFSEKFNFSKDETDNMLVIVKATLNEDMTKAELALSQGDLVSLRNASHSIKGALMSLGLNSCADLAHRLEQHKSRKDENIIPGLKDQFGALKKALTPLL